MASDLDFAAVLTDRVYHRRTHPIFLPLSVRQNRIEDVFLHFLTWLSGRAATGAAVGDGGVTADARVELLLSRLNAAQDLVRMPSSTEELDLLRRWMRSELVVGPKASNSTETSATSIVPLHLSVARFFAPPGNPPNYGRFISDLLSVGPHEADLSLLEQLRECLSGPGGDYVSQVVSAAFATDNSGAEPPFRDLASTQTWVWAVEHAGRFQTQVTNALRYAETVSRRTLIEWLYALVTFFVATYLLRMARFAEAYAFWLEGRLATDIEPAIWVSDADSPDYAPGLWYGHSDETHARLMKRLPQFTSEAAIGRALASALVGQEIDETDLARIGQIIGEEPRDEAFGLLRQACLRYPTGAGRRDRWRLASEERVRIVERADRNGVQPFITLSQLLNFEDMTRSSNNVMEWQFYSTLARNPQYGFARRASGDSLHCQFSDTLLTVLVHCHAAERSHPTLESLAAYLTGVGVALDGDGRALLERQLVLAGFLEPFADASDAKYIKTTYALAR